ncbi:hypothetical protein [Sphingomonas psychrolutea]|uniref:TonB C-terminal domain-containing protein n=1 Tax=Sphingomonas psychrolutea TaxID=1259676 RepID=A0ABQ1GZT8_9SPHN|nr:hypothetical protein [Sphingomonas psychrolutea]GGA53278.1 hypothetical protein GCM10011395_24510 [Sphingomonas psychrolutea]
MKNFVLGSAAVVLALTGAAPGVAQTQKRQNASVELRVTDAAGKGVELRALPQEEQQRINSLRTSLQEWGNQQPQRVRITIECRFKPFGCTITVAF